MPTSEEAAIRAFTTQLTAFRTELMSALNTSMSGLSAKSAHSEHSEHGHGISFHAMFLPIYHIIVDSLNLLGVVIMAVAAIGAMPVVLARVLPGMFSVRMGQRSHGHLLKCRMQLSRGVMLGMDFMVASDVIETLSGQADMVKLLFIVTIRSWLGWERGKEVEHMSHELEDWEKNDEKERVRDELEAEENKNTEYARKIAVAFHEFDMDQDGMLGHQDLKETLLWLTGSEPTDEEVSAMLDQESGLTFQEFEDVLRRMTLVNDLHLASALNTDNQSSLSPPSTASVQ